MPKQISRKVSKRVSRKGSKRVSRKVSKRVSRKVSKRVSRKVTKRVSRKVSKRVSQKGIKRPSRKAKRISRNYVMTSTNMKSLTKEMREIEKVISRSLKRPIAIKPEERAEKFYSQLKNREIMEDYIFNRPNATKLFTLVFPEAKELSSKSQIIQNKIPILATHFSELV